MPECEWGARISSDDTEVELILDDDDAAQECEWGARTSSEDEVARLIMGGSRVVFLTGAGISTDSGIPTFRGDDGYWTVGSKNYAPEALATWSMYDKMPEELWRWYQYRWGKCRRALPNMGHHALVALDRLLGGRVSVVTQNVDGLHRTAGSDPARLYEIHGRLEHMRCDEATKGSCLHGLDLCDPVVADRARATIVDTPFAASDEEDECLPTCKACGVRMRPKVLWFDENYNEPFFRSDAAMATVLSCDVLVVVGTQLCTALPQYMVAKACENGAKLVRIDPEADWSVPTHLPFLHLRKRSTEALLGIVDKLAAKYGKIVKFIPRTPQAEKELGYTTIGDDLSTERRTSPKLWTEQGASSKCPRVPLRTDLADPAIYFEIQRCGKTVIFRVPRAYTDTWEVCSMLARACYDKFEKGCTEAEVISFRDACCKLMRSGRKRLTRKTWAPHYELLELTPTTSPSLPAGPRPKAAPSPSPSLSPSSSPTTPVTPVRKASKPDLTLSPGKHETTQRSRGKTPMPKTSKRIRDAAATTTPKPSRLVQADAVSRSAPCAGQAAVAKTRTTSSIRSRGASKTISCRRDSTRLTLDMITSFKKENPKLKGSAAHRRYELYKRSRTVGQALQKGAKNEDIRHDLSKGYVRLIKKGAAQARKRTHAGAAVDRKASKRANRRSC